MAYDGERLARAVLAWLQTDLAAKLDVVETAWSSVDPVTLPDPKTWHKGHKPTVVELASTAFPFVCVIVVDRTPATGKRERGEWGYQERSIILRIEYYVVAGDEETVDKIASRYAEAIVSLLQTSRIVEGYQQNDWEPRVQFTEAMRHPLAAEADIQDETDEDFLMGGRVEPTFSKG